MEARLPLPIPIDFLEKYPFTEVNKPNFEPYTSDIAKGDDHHASRMLSGHVRPRLRNSGMSCQASPIQLIS